MKIILGSAAALVVLMLVLVILALRPPELAPASGRCTSCGSSLTPVGYGLLGIGASSMPVIDRVTVDGSTFDLRQNSDGRLFLWGG